MRRLPAACLLALALPASLAGQLREQVAETGEGTVRFSYATRPEVEICEEGIRIGEHRIWWRSNGWDSGPTSCRTGSAEVELQLRRGEVRRLEILRTKAERTPGATDLGSVPPGTAARYLLSLVREGASMRAAKAAVLPAMLADVEGLWRELADLARDRALASELRKNTLFWLGQEAAEAATEGIAALARDEEEDQDVRDAAIFALSQRPDREGTPVLMELARTAREAETRRTAMFWLAQSDGEDVIAFFEAILLARGG
jgi:HEAT repeats